MAFKLRSDETIQDGIQRIACEQIDKALQEIDDAERDFHETIHQARKRCKKIRGLIRLVRPQLDSIYAEENAGFRDAARRLSPLRDTQSSLEAFDALMSHFDRSIDAGAFDPLRKQLVARREAKRREAGGAHAQLETFRQRLAERRARVAEWRLESDGFDAVEGGLLKTYARARKAMRRVYRSPDTEGFHQWRKRTKYHWHHLRLLRGAWEKPIRACCRHADELADLLGEDHDLSNLRDVLLAISDSTGPRPVQTFVGLITTRQLALRARMQPLGSRLFAEKPGEFGKRLRAYWDAWTRELEIGSAAVFDPELIST